MLFICAYDPILSKATWHLAGSLHYIGQQLEHHRTRTFQEEYLAFLKKTRRTFQRKMPLGLRARDHIRLGGDGPFQGTLSQALRARPPSQTTARPTARGSATTYCGRDVGFAESGYDRRVPTGRACNHFATLAKRSIRRQRSPFYLDPESGEALIWGVAQDLTGDSK